MPSEEKVFHPNSEFQKRAHISTFQQYQQNYELSVTDPTTFWANIAKQFYWETPADPSKFLQFNFDIGKGPIFIKWMEGASTNLCFNLLDRNIKNGLGGNIAFFW